MRTMTKLLHKHLSAIRPKKDEIDAARSALRMETGRETTVIRKGWAGILGFCYHDLVFVGVQTLTKPPKQSLAICNMKPHACLPSERPNELACAAKRMGLHASCELVALFELCNLDYGLVSKDCSAIQVQNVTQLSNIPDGLEPGEFDEFWWQKWGGKLYGVRGSLSAATVQLLAKRTGEYRCLPKWIGK